ncbi:MAG TPA: D-alanine--D-alanine ligase family protein [Dehalococcoidia bacterium]|nr:D-alanine--D-alanine ligase family protein [Dehalococcoidia bacterium]
MPKRQRLGLIFGGRSVEHEVSVVSAQHVIAAADPARFEVVPIGVTKDGTWLSPEETQSQLARPDPPFKKTLVSSGEAAAFNPQAVSHLQRLDVVFPLIHGTHGEDGTLQGLLEIAGLPYVGCGVAASALGMDKALMKAVFAAEGLPVAEHVVLYVPPGNAPPFTVGSPPTDLLAIARDVEARLGFPAFVKPANGGSSLGVSKVRGREELVAAITEASRFDRKLLVERAIEGREVECAVLGNDFPEATPLGEIRHQRDFYDYEAKYLDPNTQVIAPADLPQDVVERGQALALRAFRALGCSGMSRVDFFLTLDGSLIIDEINTIPGFTPASMFPRLWQAIGVSYSELITRLVDLAMAREEEKPVA